MRFGRRILSRMGLMTNGLPKDSPKEQRRRSLRRMDSLRNREKWWWWQDPQLWGKMLVIFGVITFLLTVLIFVLLELDPQSAKQDVKTSQDMNNTHMDYDPIGNMSVLLSPMPPNWEAMNFSFNLWKTAQAEQWGVCTQRPSNHMAPPSENDTNGYLMIAVAGGLNQMRLGVCDAVVVARLLNATLLLPQFDNESWWGDQSKFEDVFDMDKFITTLAPDVRVLPELPKSLEDMPHFTKTVPRHSTLKFYLTEMLPLLKSKRLLRFKHFDFRLADKLADIELQKLRCRVNYDGLGFASHLEKIGREIVQKVRGAEGPFIALHLRYEPDMLAFTMCDYGGTAEEKRTLLDLRKRWPNLHNFSPERQRRKGVCVLTPAEVGRALMALGYPQNTHIYIASGPLYGGDKALAPLRATYPNLTNKTELVPKEVFEPLGEYASQLAAIDYYVCFHADVFVSNNNGNMARMLAGHRRFAGHKRTIRLRGGELLAVLDHKTGRELEARIRLLFDGHAGEPGAQRVKEDGGFYSFPFECLCRNST